MQSRATIMHAKVNGSEYGRESTLTLTLDVKLPTPVEVRSINEWAASELDWQARQEIAKAQQRRRNGAKPEKLTKAQKKAQAEAHEQTKECGIASCESCYEPKGEENLVCLGHQLPWLECPECDGEGGIFLDPEDTERLRSRYEHYTEEQGRLNRDAVLAAQEAALFLLLIKKPVQVSIAPAQRAFADLLTLSAPNA